MQSISIGYASFISQSRQAIEQLIEICESFQVESKCLDLRSYKVDGVAIHLLEQMIESSFEELMFGRLLFKEETNNEVRLLKALTSCHFGSVKTLNLRINYLYSIDQLSFLNMPLLVHLNLGICLLIKVLQFGFQVFAPRLRSKLHHKSEASRQDELAPPCNFIFGYLIQLTKHKTQQKLESPLTEYASTINTLMRKSFRPNAISSLFINTIMNLIISQFQRQNLECLEKKNLKIELVLDAQS